MLSEPSSKVGLFSGVGEIGRQLANQRLGADATLSDEALEGGERRYRTGYAGYHLPDREDLQDCVSMAQVTVPKG
jgi:hypothetical protein